MHALVMVPHQAVAPASADTKFTSKEQGTRQ